MSIKFLCEHCQKEVVAPDEAAGKRGKCPYCKQSNYIPALLDEEDILPLSPLDEEAERKQQEEVRSLLQEERALMSETGQAPGPPLEQRDDLSSQDLHHFVVNYCLDMAAGKLDRAQTHVARLRKFREQGLEAVGDFASGAMAEPALNGIPAPVLQGYLKQLRASL